MTVLVTGGAGFIAASLIDRLLARGDMVLALDNFSRGRRSNVAAFVDHRRFALVELDLSDVSAYRRVLANYAGLGTLTAVWHLAANSDIPAGIADAGIDLRDTFLTTFNTLKLMEEYNIPRIMFASSSAIYGDLGTQELTEDIGPLLPVSNYGAMKLASEAAISAAVEKFVKSAIMFRFPNVVGVPATHGVIMDFIKRLRVEPDHLQVLGDGTQQKCYLHVSDLVDAMLLVQQRCDAGVHVYNIGPVDDGVTVRRIAEESVAVVAPGAELRFGTGNKGWVGDVPRFRYSTAKLQNLGWSPKLDSLGAVRRAIREIASQDVLA